MSKIAKKLLGLAKGEKALTFVYAVAPPPPGGSQGLATVVCAVEDGPAIRIILRRTSGAPFLASNLDWEDCTNLSEHDFVRAYYRRGEFVVERDISHTPAKYVRSFLVCVKEQIVIPEYYCEEIDFPVCKSAQTEYGEVESEKLYGAEHKGMRYFVGDLLIGGRDTEEKILKEVAERM